MIVYEVELLHTHDTVPDDDGWQDDEEYWTNVHQSYLFSTRKKALEHIRNANAPRDVERLFEGDYTPERYKHSNAAREFMCIDGKDIDVWTYVINERPVF